MAERKPLSKKIRFEVFKRDKFTCQYCGRMAPDVMLEVDHIKPVAKGGTNKITNLITSCHDCNSGKSDRELSDDAVVKRQQEQMLIAANKREQLEMMEQWREELDNFEDEQVYKFENYLRKIHCMPDGISLSEHGVKKVKQWLKEYSFAELTEAASELSNRYDSDVFTNDNDGRLKFDEFFSKIPNIAKYKKNPMSDEQKKVFYLRKILINRLSYMDKAVAYVMIDDALRNGTSYEDIHSICCTCTSWTNFKDRMHNLTSEYAW